MKRFITTATILFLLLVAVVLLIASKNNAIVSGKLKVVATTSQLYDITKNIVQDKVELTSIFSANIDPHEYEPTIENIRNLEDADLIIENGLGLEAKINKNITNVSAKILTVSDAIDKISDDPHIWFSVNNVKVISQEIKDFVSQYDSTNGGFYTANQNKYLSDLTDLDSYIRSQITTIPVSQRKVVTNHDAFGYYLKEYNLEFIGSIIPNLSTDSQPSVQEINDLIQKIKAENVKTIFTENSINPKLAEQIANEAGVQVVSNLYGDALGTSGSPADTYIKMMMYDTDVFVQSLR